MGKLRTAEGAQRSTCKVWTGAESSTLEVWLPFLGDETHTCAVGRRVSGLVVEPEVCEVKVAPPFSVERDSTRCVPPVLYLRREGIVVVYLVARQKMYSH